MRPIKTYDIYEELEQLKRALKSLNEYALAFDNLMESLPDSFDYPTLGSDYIQNTATRIFKEWNIYRNQYVFVVITVEDADLGTLFNSEYFKRADNLNPESIETTINKIPWYYTRKITNIGLLNRIERLELPDHIFQHHLIEHLTEMYSK